MHDGDAGADDPQFEAQFNELYKRAYVVAFHVVRSREDAEDVAIEAVARASLHWKRIRDHSESWVTRVSANLAIDSLRTRRRTDELREIPVCDPETSDHLDLVRATRKLPRRQREALALRYFVGLSEQETAAAMGCSTGTVKQHCSRGIAKLKKAIAPTAPLEER